MMELIFGQGFHMYHAGPQGLAKLIPAASSVTQHGVGAVCGPARLSTLGLPAVILQRGVSAHPHLGKSFLSVV